MKNKKYTFEDWIEGNIPEPPIDKNVNSLNYWTYISKPARIDESEFQKIRSIQKETFFELVNKHAVELQTTFLFDWNKLSPEKQIEFFKIEIKNVNERLKDYNLLKKVKLRQWDPNAITPVVYKNYMQSNYFPIKGKKSERGFYISFPTKHENVFGEMFYSEDPTIAERSGDTIPNLGDLYEAHVYYMYMNDLEELSEMILSNNDSLEEKITGVNLSEEEEPNILRKKKTNPDHVKYKKILDSAESIPAGKIAFFRFIEKKFDLRNQSLALEKANEIYNQMFGKSLYKNLNSLQVSLSKFNKRRLS